MHNHQDVEQGAQEYALAQQMRSIRRQWIRFVIGRTVLLLMVPFGSVWALSVYFYLFALDNVLTALWITAVISFLLIIYAHLTSVDFIKGEHRCGLNLLFMFVVFYAPLFMSVLPSIWSFLGDDFYKALGIIVIHTLSGRILFDALVITAQYIFGGRYDQFDLEEHGLASFLLSLSITFIYTLVLANVVIANSNAKQSFVHDLMRLYVHYFQQ